MKLSFSVDNLERPLLTRSSGLRAGQKLGCMTESTRCEEPDALRVFNGLRRATDRARREFALAEISVRASCQSSSPRPWQTMVC
jgi:hypothetical protein